MNYLNILIKNREKEFKRMPAIEVKAIEENSKSEIDRLVFNKLNKTIYERNQNK
jgi:hypothetical protein